MVNNSRFLLLPDQTSPNLGSAVVSHVTARLSDDWMERYGHPALVIETFVDTDIVEQVLVEWKRRICGPVTEKETVAIDGRQPRHAGGHNVVTAVTTPSQHDLGCELVADTIKDNTPETRTHIESKLPDPGSPPCCPLRAPWTNRRAPP